MVRFFGTQIQLPADPAGAMQAATKQYVDAAALDASRIGDYPIDQYGLVAVSINIDSWVSASQTLPTGTLKILRVYVPANKAITGAVVNLQGAGSSAVASNDSGFCLWSDDGQTQIAKTVNDYTIWTTSGWRTKAFPSVIAAQSAGRFVRLGMLATCSTPPGLNAGLSTINTMWNTLIPSGTHIRAITNAVTTFPATFTPGSYGTTDSVVRFVGLY